MYSMDKNYRHKIARMETRIQILKILLIDELSLDDLVNQLQNCPDPIQRSTLFKYLGPMVNEGLIEPIIDITDRRNRRYKITLKGLELLNDLDADTKGRIFTALVYTGINSILNNWKIFDDRLPENTFNELMEMLKQMDDAAKQGNNKLYEQMNKNFSKRRDEELAKLEKIADSDVSLRYEFYDILSRFISAAVSYISVKFIENKKIETINLLNNLPHLLATRLMIYNVPTAQIQNKDAVIWNLIDKYYEQSQTITPEKYKKILDVYEEEADVLFMEAVGGDFMAKKYKKALEELKNKKQKLKNNKKTKSRISGQP